MHQADCYLPQLLRLQAERDLLSAEERGCELFKRRMELEAEVKKAMAELHAAEHELEDSETAEEECVIASEQLEHATVELTNFLQGELVDYYCVIDGQIDDLQQLMGIPKGAHMQIDIVRVKKSTGVKGFFKKLVGSNSKMN